MKGWSPSDIFLINCLISNEAGFVCQLLSLKVTVRTLGYPLLMCLLTANEGELRSLLHCLAGFEWVNPFSYCGPGNKLEKGKQRVYKWCTNDWNDVQITRITRWGEGIWDIEGSWGYWKEVQEAKRKAGRIFWWHHGGKLQRAQNTNLLKNNLHWFYYSWNRVVVSWFSTVLFLVRKTEHAFINMLLLTTGGFKQLALVIFAVFKKAMKNPETKFF